MWEWLKFWKGSKGKNGVVYDKPYLLLQYDIEKDTAVFESGWPEGINKKKLAENWPLILFSLQNGRFNSLLIENLRKLGTDNGEQEFCEFLIQQLNNHFTHQQSQFLNQQLIFPDEVFHPKGRD